MFTIDLYKFLFFATHLIRLYMNRFQTHHVSFWEYRSILTLLPILGVNIYIWIACIMLELGGTEQQGLLTQHL